MREMETEKRPGMGCVAKGLIGCAIAGVIIVVGGLLTGWYVLFHTAIPAKMIASLLNNDPKIQIEGISGSLSEGFAVETIRIKDDDGNTNELDDVRLKYEKDGDLIIITEVHVGRGYFYVDRSTGDTSFTEGETSELPPEMQEENSDAETDQLKVLVKSISINDITIEDKTTGEKFKLQGIQLDNLMIGPEFSMGKLIVESDACNLSIVPADGAETGSSFTVNGTFKPGIHDNLIAPFDVKGTIDASDVENAKADLSAFGGKISMKGEANNHTFALTGFSFSDYFKSAPPVTDVNANVVVKDEVGTVKGSFKIGANTFILDHTIKVPKDQKQGARDDVVATCVREGTTYEVRIPGEDMDNKLFPTLVLKTTPPMPHEDAVTTLLTGSKGDLTPEQKAKVEDALKYVKDTMPEVQPTKKAENKPAKTPAGDASAK